MINLARFRVWFAKDGFSRRVSSCRRLSNGFEMLEKRELLANWYVAPDGLASNPGTIEAPWDIHSGLSNGSDVQPGDTIWLRGGTYYHPDRSYDSKFSLNLAGTSEAPITVRAYPGERATLDGGELVPSAWHVRIQDLEFIVSENLTQSRVVDVAGAIGYSAMDRPKGAIDLKGGTDVKIINCVFHANWQGITFSKGVSGDSELYGNIIYDNGWIGPDRYHGPGLYAQNNSGDWKHIRNNLFFDNYSTNIQCTGASSARIDRFHVEDNFFFNKTAIGLVRGYAAIGSYDSGNQGYLARVDGNVAYASRFNIGYSGGIDDVVATGNTVVRNDLHFNATNLTAEDNFVWRGDLSSPPKVDDVEVPAPTEPLVFLHPNAYDSNRANLAIMAFQGQTEVIVDVSSFLEIGDTFRLMDPTDFYGQPVFVGAYAGNPVSIPITDEFNAYIMLKDASAPTNDPPVARDDAASTEEETPVTIDVLANDTDPEGDPLWIAILSSNGGTAAVNDGGTPGVPTDDVVEFTPATGFQGIASFTYRVNDGRLDSNAATVTVEVAPINDPPVARDDAASTEEETPVTIDVLANDADPEGDPLWIAILSSNGGTAAVNDGGTPGDPTDDAVTFTPATDFQGTASFTYRVNDGGLNSDVATVTVEVSPINDPPVARDDAASTEEETPVTIDVLANDADPEGDPLWIAILSSSGGTAMVKDGGTPDIPTDDAVTFTPATNFQGIASFTYRVNDGGLDSNVAAVTVEVSPINDPPVARDDAASTEEETPVTIDVLANDADPEGDPLWIAILSSSGGTAAVNDGGTPDIPTDDAVTFTPATNFQGIASFTYRVNDGGLDSNVAAVTVEVAPINDPPVAHDDAGTTDNNDEIPVRIDVLANDTDPEGDPLWITILSSNGGTAVVKDGGTPGDPTDDAVEFTPATDFQGTAGFTYRVNDGQLDSNVATVTVEVLPSNNPPVANDDAFTIAQDGGPLQLGVLGNDAGNDAGSAVDPATVTIVADPGHGIVLVNGDGTVTYTSQAKFFGTDTFRYTVQDDEGATSNQATVTIRVASMGDTVGLYDDGMAAFHLKNANANPPPGADAVFRYGPRPDFGWIALTGDWDGDGVATAGLYDAYGGVFHLKNSNSSEGGADMIFRFGPKRKHDCQPLVGDWDGDGIDSVGLYNPKTAAFHLKNVNANPPRGADITMKMGPRKAYTWQALAGDWDGDGVDTIGLYYPTTAGFFLKNSDQSVVGADLAFTFGPAGDAGAVALAGDWNQNGIDTVGLYAPHASGFMLKRTHRSSLKGDAEFVYGAADYGWQPLVGDWDGSGASALGATGNEASSSDSAPLADAEPQPANPGEGLLCVDPSAVDGMDLLTAASDELASVLGSEALDPAGESPIGGRLRPGLRHEPTTAEIDAYFSRA